MRHAHRLSVRAATAILIACVLAATAVIVVGTRSSASQHDNARIEAAHASNNSALYEDALGSSYEEWVRAYI
jgi:sensor domain CHASE-containing protein